MDEARKPAGGGLGDLGGLDGEKARDGGPGEVDVEDADIVRGEGEGQRKLCGYGGLAHAAFSGEDL
jgi:hypothetical protein